MHSKWLLVTIASLAFIPAIEAPAADAAPADNTPSISAIIDDYHKSRQQFRDRSRAASSAEERRKLESERPSVFDTARAMAKAIERTPADPAVIDAAGWILSNAPEKDVLAILIPALEAHHARSEDIASFCLLAAREAGEAFAGLMEKISQENPHPPARAAGAYALGCILRDSDDRAKQARAEEVFASIMARHADVAMGDFSFRKAADDALFKMQHLRVGKSAPEIEAEDAEGKKFKLSDHRGKAVVVSFFGFW
jgi:hypothetical protein